MISWITASHDAKVLEANLLSTLTPKPGEELLVEWDAPSIAVAYNRAGARAVNPIRVYVHHDVQVLDPPRLREELLRACTPLRGMVGVIGSLGAGWPWWEAPGLCGSAQDARLGRLWFGPGGHASTMLDGALLATSQEITWDEGYTGWHGYDHDICLQQFTEGRVNWVIPEGAGLVLHNRVADTSPVNTDMIPGWAEAEARFRAKWSSI